MNNTHKIVKCWKNLWLEIFVNTYYHSKDLQWLWAKIFKFWGEEYPNLCLHAQIIIPISGSNSKIKRALSTLRVLLSERQLCMKHNRREILSIRIRDKNWYVGKRRNSSDVICLQKHPKSRLPFRKNLCQKSKTTIETSKESNFGNWSSAENEEITHFFPGMRKWYQSLSIVTVQSN